MPLLLSHLKHPIKQILSQKSQSTGSPWDDFEWRVIATLLRLSWSPGDYYLWPCSNGLIHTFARDSTAFLGILFFSVLSSDLFSLMSYMKESHLEITEKTRIPRTEVQNMSRS